MSSRRCRRKMEPGEMVCPPTLKLDEDLTPGSFCMHSGESWGACAPPQEDHLCLIPFSLSALCVFATLRPCERLYFLFYRD
jgi:hypothetical protein